MGNTSGMSIGKKIERIRILRGVKQDSLATALGVSQQAISKLEASEQIDDERLEKVAQALNVPIDAIKNFSEEAAINYFNTFNDSSVSHMIANYGTYNLNTDEDYSKLVEENKRLYERLLQAEKEKNALLESLLKK